MRNRWTTGLLSGLLTVAVLPVSPVSAVSGEVIGYGQGTAVDSENRPVDAVAFDAQYARYDAYATTPDRSQILLTFDQGYENGYTGQILDTLREKQVHAVFFLTGDYAKKETDLVNRMIAEGHVLGNHGMTHASLPTLSEAEAKAEIMDLHQYVLDKYGYEMQYFRCPCGEYSEAALETAQACGYRTLFWSDAYVDWKTDAQPDPAGHRFSSPRRHRSRTVSDSRMPVRFPVPPRSIPRRGSGNTASHSRICPAHTGADP